MDRCFITVTNHRNKKVQCVLEKGHEGMCAADAATVLYRVRDGKYLDVETKPWVGYQ